MKFTDDQQSFEGVFSYQKKPNCLAIMISAMSGGKRVKLLIQRIKTISSVKHGGGSIHIITIHQLISKYQPCQKEFLCVRFCACEKKNNIFPNSRAIPRLYLAGPVPEMEKSQSTTTTKPETSPTQYRKHLKTRLESKSRLETSSPTSNEQKEKNNNGNDIQNGLR